MLHEPCVVVELVYALPERVIRKDLCVAAPATVADALAAAAADADFFGIDLTHAAVGIYGRLARPEQPLRAGDRIEIYRPLKLDPKAARRARAKQAGKKRGG